MHMDMIALIFLRKWSNGGLGGRYSGHNNHQNHQRNAVISRDFGL